MPAPFGCLPLAFGRVGETGRHPVVLGLDGPPAPHFLHLRLGQFAFHRHRFLGGEAVGFTGSAIGVQPASANAAAVFQHEQRFPLGRSGRSGDDKRGDEDKRHHGLTVKRRESRSVPVRHEGWLRRSESRPKPGIRAATARAGPLKA